MASDAEGGTAFALDLSEDATREGRTTDARYFRWGNARVHVPAATD